MATLLEKYALRTSDTLRQRLTAAMTDAARDILNEDTNTPNHANRLAWAHTVLRDANAAEQEARAHQWRLLLNVTVAAAGEAATDGDITYVTVAEILPVIIASA
jgi:hypothetical protein